MSEFKHLDTTETAGMATVAVAVARLSTFSERQLLELVSEGKLGELFPFRTSSQALPPDFVEEQDLEEASPMPLSRARRAALIQSSMPASASAKAKSDQRKLEEALAHQAQTLRNDY